MGGWGSGRPVSRYAGTVGQVKQLDVRALAKLGALAVGTRWHLPSLGFELTTDTRGVLVAGNGPTYRVWLEATPCNFGGVRHWWRCPVVGCGRRCAVLYLRRVLTCRQCARLTYQTHRADLGRRGAIKAAKAWLKLGIDPDVGPYLEWIPRPKGMRLRTFDRIADAIQHAETMRAEHFVKSTAGLLRRYERRRV